ADHAEAHAEFGALKQHKADQHGAKNGVDENHEIEGFDVVVEDVADVSKPVGAVGTDHLAVDFNLIVEQFEQDSHHLGECQRGDGKEDSVQAEGGDADKDGTDGTDGGAPDNGKRQRPAPHGGGDPRRIGADGKEGLLAEGNLAGQQ